MPDSSSQGSRPPGRPLVRTGRGRSATTSSSAAAGPRRAPRGRAGGGGGGRRRVRPPGGGGGPPHPLRELGVEGGDPQHQGRTGGDVLHEPAGRGGGRPPVGGGGA